VEAEEVEEGFREWDHQEGGSPRWIHTDLEETLVVKVDQVVTKTLSLGSEAWVKAAEVEAGTRAVEVGVMEGMEVPEGMTIVITMGEATTVEGGEEITEVVEVVTVNVGEEVVVEVVVGDTELSLAYALS